MSHRLTRYDHDQVFLFYNKSHV